MGKGLKGFTLVEMVIAMGLMSVSLLASLELAKLGSQSNNTIEGASAIQSTHDQISLIYKNSADCMAAFSGAQITETAIKNKEVILLDSLNTQSMGPLLQTGNRLPASHLISVKGIQLKGLAQENQTGNSTTYLAELTSQYARGKVTGEASGDRVDFGSKYKDKSHRVRLTYDQGVLTQCDFQGSESSGSTAMSDMQICTALGGTYNMTTKVCVYRSLTTESLSIVSNPKDPNSKYLTTTYDSQTKTASIDYTGKINQSGDLTVKGLFSINTNVTDTYAIIAGAPKPALHVQVPQADLQRSIYAIVTPDGTGWLDKDLSNKTVTRHLATGLTSQALISTSKNLTQDANFADIYLTGTTVRHGIYPTSNTKNVIKQSVGLEVVGYRDEGSIDRLIGLYLRPSGAEKDGVANENYSLYSEDSQANLWHRGFVQIGLNSNNGAPSGAGELLYVNGGSNPDTARTRLGSKLLVEGTTQFDKFTHHKSDVLMDKDLHVTGNVFANSYRPSDRKLKCDIENLTDPLQKILALRPRTYHMKTDQPHAPLSIGFIAQELQKTLPNLVKEMKPGTVAVDYIGLIPVLVGAIQEQQKQIDDLKEKINKLESR